jgi:hypothetical protein
MLNGQVNLGLNSILIQSTVVKLDLSMSALRVTRTMSSVIPESE